MSASSKSIKTQNLMRRAAEMQRAGRSDQAKGLLQQVVRLDPAHYTALCALGQLNAGAGQIEFALSLFERANQARPDGFESLALIARCQQQLGNISAAAAATARAADLQPNNDRVFFNLGVLREQLGEFATAREAYGQAVRLNPGNLDAQSNLAMLSLSEAPDHAVALLANVHQAKRGDPALIGAAKPLPNLPGNEQWHSKFKLKMELEQLEYLAQKGKLPEFAAGLPDALRSALEDLADLDDDNESFRRQHPRHHWKSHWQLINRLYNRTLYLPEPPVIDGPLINPDLDVQALQDTYLNGDPQLVVVDNFLTEPALAAIRDFCQEATIWHDLRRNYLGAYLTDGFANTLTLGIANALKQSLPGIFKGHELAQGWGYKYGAAVTGIGMHADAAAVNCNFWITDDSANEDPDSGGLLVYDKEAPLDWDFETFNNNTEAMLEFLGDSIDTPVHIPHRANRIVIFNSNLFHRTDDIHFKDTFAARRYNITMLYGRRGRQTS